MQCFYGGTDILKKETYREWGHWEGDVKVEI